MIVLANIQLRVKVMHLDVTATGEYIWLLKQTMEVFERIIERRLRELVKIESHKRKSKSGCCMERDC